MGPHAAARACGWLTRSAKVARGCEGRAPVARFLVLYNSPISASEQMEMSSPEEMKAGMDLWMAWSRDVGPALVDFGLPLGGSNRVEGGSTSPGTSQATGYSIIEAESLEA